MKADIHPEYVETRVTCSCGNTFTTRSTKPELHVELCNKCHPFYTGKQKLVDTGGRVERFQRKYAKRAQASSQREAASAGSQNAREAASAGSQRGTEAGSAGSQNAREAGSAGSQRQTEAKTAEQSPAQEQTEAR